MTLWFVVWLGTISISLSPCGMRCVSITRPSRPTLARRVRGRSRGGAGALSTRCGCRRSGPSSWLPSVASSCWVMRWCIYVLALQRGRWASRRGSSRLSLCLVASGETVSVRRCTGGPRGVACQRRERSLAACAPGQSRLDPLLRASRLQHVRPMAPAGERSTHYLGAHQSLDALLTVPIEQLKLITKRS